MDDEALLARAEAALTEIKIGQGLSEHHAAVLAALRIRLKGSEGKSLEEMLEAADDPGPDILAEKLAEAERESKPTLDDLIQACPSGTPCMVFESLRMGTGHSNAPRGAPKQGGGHASTHALVAGSDPAGVTVRTDSGRECRAGRRSRGRHGCRNVATRLQAATARDARRAGACCPRAGERR